MPTSCRPNVAYFSPEKYGGQQGLLQIPIEDIDEILEAQYPDGEALCRISPALLSQHVSESLWDLGVPADAIIMNHFWHVHQSVVTRLVEVHYHIYHDLDMDRLLQPEQQIDMYIENP